MTMTTSMIQKNETAQSYQPVVCSRLVMDTADPAITFDENGVCNYWYEFQAFRESIPSREMREQALVRLVDEIRRSGRHRNYDCVLGLSGGADSSYLLVLARQLGLRPLVVHFDNGWNSELAIDNIQRLVSGLDLDLQTYVMDWPSFRDVQQAYFKASVVDLEVPTDHMIFGALHKIAAANRITYILSGTNYATEWLMPKAWNYRKNDVRNLEAIHRRFGTRPLRKFPKIGVWSAGYYRVLRGIRTVSLLDYVDYRRSDATRLLQKDFGWRDYGGKHHESVFTRFYQGYILPRKFGIDKRKAHLSNLILNGEMTREAALCELQTPTYPEIEQKRDKMYVAKKLGFSADEFEAVLSLPNQSHESYGTDAYDRERYFRMVRFLKQTQKVFGLAAASSRSNELHI